MPSTSLNSKDTKILQNSTINSIEISPAQDTSNNQKVFNLVWQHFVVEKRKQSIVEDDYSGEAYWAYRGPYRRRDAIGLFISDEDYHEDMEGMGIDEVIEAYPNLQLPTKDIDFLVALEWAHNLVAQSDEEFTQKIQMRLRIIAEDFTLEIPK